MRYSPIGTSLHTQIVTRIFLTEPYWVVGGWFWLDHPIFRQISLMNFRQYFNN
ncbi:MAG: hypothetical protein NHB32_21865 [Fischerella sp. CENA71]|nr:hypothetical protein [Fischerella sp. CENA71]